jgi:nitrogen fixation protein FixH
MTLTATLFGGAVLIVLLYFGLRLAGVSNYWRGVISGSLPTLAFIAYSMNHWPGGDGMALHIALYLATAIVLTLTGGRKAAAGGKVHWFPLILIGCFVLLAFLQAIFLTISTRGLPSPVASLILPNASGKTVYTAFSGEVPHDQEAAKTVSQYMNKTLQQRELAWQIEVAGLDHLRTDRAQEITVSAKDRLQQPLDNATVHVTFTRPAAAAAAHTADLGPAGPGRYQGRIRLDQPGQWVAVLTIQRGQDSFESAKEILIPAM